MNRRGFFRALAATAVIAFASQTKLVQHAISVREDAATIGRDYAEALVRSLIETKETLDANILNRSFS